MTRYKPQQDLPAATPTYRTIRIRRRSTAEWLAWGLWLVVLAILLEYALGSFAEYEQQAGVLAGALFIGLLSAGVIVHFMRGIDVRSQYRYQAYHPQPDEWVSTADDAEASESI